MLVPTSAQAQLCRRRRYADLGVGALAAYGIRPEEVGITIAGLMIVSNYFSREGDDRGWVYEQGEQGVDDGAVGSVC